MAELWWIMAENKFKKWHLDLSLFFLREIFTFVARAVAEF